MFKDLQFKKALNIALTVLLSILMVLVLIFTIYAFNSKKNGGIPNIFGKSYLVVRTNSMNTKNEEYNFKGFGRGDIIVIERYTWVEASTKKFEKGDIITFKFIDENNNLKYNTHRIVEVHDEGNEKYYITQGDVAAKKGLPIDVEGGTAEKVYFIDVVGSYKKTVRNVGYIFLFLESVVGFLIVIVLPLIALFILEIFNFRKAYIEYKQEKSSVSMSPEDIQKEIERLRQQLENKEKEAKKEA